MFVRIRHCSPNLHGIGRLSLQPSDPILRTPREVPCWWRPWQNLAFRTITYSSAHTAVAAFLHTVVQPGRGCGSSDSTSRHTRVFAQSGRRLSGTGGFGRERFEQPIGYEATERHLLVHGYSAQFTSYTMQMKLGRKYTIASPNDSWYSSLLIPLHQLMNCSSRQQPDQPLTEGCCHDR